MRLVSLLLDHYAEVAAREEIPPKVVQEAIGYLTTWALDSYDQLIIQRDREDTDLVAHYSNEHNSRVYTIGAIYHADSKQYSFHS